MSTVFVIVAVTFILNYTDFWTYVKKQNYELKNYPVDQAKSLAKSGRIFTFDELLKFGDKAGDIVLIMVQQKHYLSVDDLLKLNITAGRYIGWQISFKLWP